MSTVIDGEVLVLEEDIVHADFVKLAKEKKWIKEKVQHGDGEKVSFQEIWKTSDGGGVINYVDDPLTMTRYLWVRGPRLNNLLFELCRRLPAYEPEELLEKALEPESHSEAVESIFKLAVGFPRFDEDAFKIFEQYLESPNPTLRRATIQAIAYRLWQETEPLLQKVSQEDPDENVREFANMILAYLKHSE